MPFDAGALTGPQLRAARALLGLSGEELANETRLGLATIRRAEAEGGVVRLTRANALLLVATLERLGVQFLAADKVGGPGVRMALREPRRR